MAIFDFKSKKDEVLSHWFAFVDGSIIPPQEFYEAIQKELEIRKIPGMDISQVDYAEGGMLSGKRIYLRMIRERLAFDLCASPFGRSYFFSCRAVYSPVLLRLWHILVVFIGLTAFANLLVKPLGLDFAMIAVAGLILATVQVFRNTVAMGLHDLDALLIKIPALGPIYERWFRKDTYYREDTRLVYLEAVSKLVKETAEEITAAKGVKLVEQYENAPVLGRLYERVPPRTPEPPEP